MVDQSADGRDGLFLASETGYDVMVIDRMLPRVDGLAIVKTVRAAGVKAPVLILTTLGGVNDRVEGLDILINNAGVSHPDDLNDRAAFERHLAVNLYGTLDVTRAFLPLLTRGRGAVVNVSSVAGFMPGRPGSYGADKAWVTFFTEGVAASLRGTGVRAMALCPGFVRTDFHRRAGIDVGARRGPFWLDATRVVDEGLADLDRGKVLSVPSRQYRALVAVADLLPRPLLRRCVRLAYRKQVRP